MSSKHRHAFSSFLVAPREKEEEEIYKTRNAKKVRLDEGFELYFKANVLKSREEPMRTELESQLSDTTASRRFRVGELLPSFFFFTLYAFSL